MIKSCNRVYIVWNKYKMLHLLNMLDRWGGIKLKFFIRRKDKIGKKKNIILSLDMNVEGVKYKWFVLLIFFHIRYLEDVLEF